MELEFLELDLEELKFQNSSRSLIISQTVVEYQ